MYAATITNSLGEILDPADIATIAAEIGNGTHEAYDEEDGLWLVDLNPQNTETLAYEGWLEIHIITDRIDAIVSIEMP